MTSFRSRFRKLVLASAMLAAICAHAQTQSPINNGPGNIDQQVIGDTVNSLDRTNSTTNQLGNSAASNGNDLSTSTDIRTQISPTNNSSTSSNALGANLALGNNSDAHASNGPQTMGQANTGNSAIGNTTATTGPSTSSVGNTTAAGGAGGQGGQGGAGGSSTGTNLGINGQQQGIAGSGNSDSRNNNAVTGGDQRNAQGQQQAANANGTNTSRQSTSAGNGAGAGAGSNNKTTLQVDASDRSSTSYVAKSIVLPPVLHGQAAPPLASASMTVVPGVCGPRHYTEVKPVRGTHHGIIWDSEVQQGNDYEAVPATVPFIEKDGYVLGHVLNEFMAVIGTSSSKSISAWGVGSNQNGGGGGAANSGSHQQMVVRITIKECLLPVKQDAIAVLTGSIQPADRTHGPAPRADRN